jgi:hypothetical protein
MIDQRIAFGTAFLTAVVAEAAPVTKVFDIPIAVLLAAYAGALFGLAHTPPRRWSQLFALPANQSRVRRCLSITWRVFGLVFTTAGNATAIAAFVTLLPHLPGMGWAEKLPLAAGAFALAFGSQYVIVPALEAGQRWIEARAPRAGGKRP